ncbi:MAG: D-2-hydroxyacid dehydrogenase [Cyclobacteriaceae bacterium]|nr:D-2-hydroxyacid dehydrogenase [Cyclobacteriaceae bacterium]
MKIVFLDCSTVGDLTNIDRLRDFGDLICYDKTAHDERLERTTDADIIITNKVVMDKAVMDNGKNLKLICISATGMNNVDLEYAGRKNIGVMNVGNYSTYSVTQSTFSMLFYLLNHTRYYDDYVKNGEYVKSPIFTHHGRPFYELKNKVFGIIGLGTIGKSVARLAKAFECRVIYYSTSGNNIDPEFRSVDLDELLDVSDIISIHAPLNDRTINLIDYTEIKRMKSSAIMINVGRGGIINESGLARALNEDLILGAAIDVLSQEPISADNPLLRVRNRGKLLITPHIAWASIESRTLLMDKIYENISLFLKDQAHQSS